MKLIQYNHPETGRAVGRVEGDRVTALRTVRTVYELVLHSLDLDISPADAADRLTGNRIHSYSDLVRNDSILLPATHPDPYHTWITGTGLTHLGSAESRDAMHRKIEQQTAEELTDSKKMFKMGLEDGIMEDGEPASQPEWFYKGNGLMARAPGRPLERPPFALDGGEEPELAGVYIIDPDSNPRRLGFVLSNDFSDHRMEQINYLYLAHSKLRTCSYGPELLLGDLPPAVTGYSRIRRDNDLLWENRFLTGEKHMTHNIANLEYHHFKYDLFRQPGDLHIHMFGTSLLSFSDGIEPRQGDRFEIGADCFDHPLCNPLEVTEKG